MGAMTLPIGARTPVTGLVTTSTGARTPLSTPPRTGLAAAPIAFVTLVVVATTTLAVLVRIGETTWTTGLAGVALRVLVAAAVTAPTVFATLSDRADVVVATSGAVAGAATGAATLATGAATLATGAATLATGAATLATGAATLATGAATLATGAATLATGAATGATGATMLVTVFVTGATTSLVACVVVCPSRLVTGAMLCPSPAAPWGWPWAEALKAVNRRPTKAAATMTARRRSTRRLTARLAFASAANDVMTRPPLMRAPECRQLTDAPNPSLVPLREP